jgi:hypothetical protein
MITVALFAMIGLSLPTGFGGWRRLLWLVAVGSHPPCPRALRSSCSRRLRDLGRSARRSGFGHMRTRVGS